MSPQPIFIETSIQVQRVLADSQTQNSLQQKIQTLSPNLYTTNYVWMEFQRTVVADVAHVKQIMSAHRGWGGLMRHLLTGQRSFRTRSAIRCTQIVGKLYESSNGNWDYAFMLCDVLLDEELETQFWHNVNPLPDSIVCDLVTKGITHQSDGNYAVAATCNKESAACLLPSFLSQNLDKLRSIENHLIAHPHALKEQVRVQRRLQAIIESPQSALGQNSCWPLGDIIIALQVPADAAVWTLDGDFAPLVKSLGLSLYDAA